MRKIRAYYAVLAKIGFYQKNISSRLHVEFLGSSVSELNLTRYFYELLENLKKVHSSVVVVTLEMFSLKRASVALTVENLFSALKLIVFVVFVGQNPV